MVSKRKTDFQKKVSHVLEKAKTDILSGTHPSHVSYGSIDSLSDGQSASLVGTGASIFIDQNHATSVTPDTHNIISMSPDAVILVKKKPFSSLRSSNDLRYMDKTEKMLLRATKALFAYKVQQIRAYESMTKFENFFEETGTYSLDLLSSFITQASRINLDRLGYTEAEFVEKKFSEWLSKSSYDIKLTNKQYLMTLPGTEAENLIDSKKVGFKQEYNSSLNEFNAIEDRDKSLEESMGEDFFDDLADVISANSGVEKYTAINDDVTRLLRRNAFSADNQLTTWIVDPDSQENYILGPGTGVVEVALFSNFTTSTSYASNPSTADFSLTYPYRLGTILEDDIDLAIKEALEGNIGIFREAMESGLQKNSITGSTPILDTESIVSSAFEMAGAGDLDGSLDMGYVKERLRTFYLGKSFISPPDPVHFYIRGNRMLQDSTGQWPIPLHKPGYQDYLSMDEAIIKAEYQLYTSQNISYEHFKNIRTKQDNSLGMTHVFGGFVKNVSESFGSGEWKLNVTCTDNMEWLSWSQFAIQPSLSDPKNILEDPLTPFSLVKDELGQIVPSERDLLHENKKLLESGMLSYDSGLFAGQSAREGNLLQGQYSGVGSLDGKKVIQHADGFVYRWKQGVVTATAGFQASGSINGGVQASQYSQNYQVTIANDVLNNLDIPNVLSILIVGQPYNVETFIEQSYAAHNKKGKTLSMSADDPLTGVMDTLKRQNEYYGNFFPYRTSTLSPESAEFMINSAGLRQNANDTVKKLRRRKVAINKKIRALRTSVDSSVGIPAKTLAATLQAEVNTIDAAINKQVRIGAEATNAISSADKVGIEIGLFGSSGLPLSGDFEENQQINRAMMMVGAQRRIEDVRLNRDRNLLIVSDQYDAADIRPFILALNSSGWKLFDSTYIGVYDKCVAAANVLNLEFFCNSQGHLEFRPPLWNKTPLTVLREIVKRQKESVKRLGQDNSQIIPTFITNIFQTRIESLRKEVYNLNVQIVMLSLMMGRFPDNSLIPNMKMSGEASLEFFGIDPDSGSGLSLNRKAYSWETGNLTEQNNSIFGEGLKLTASFSGKDGDSLSGDTETLLGDFDPIFQEQAGVTQDLLTVVAVAGSTAKNKLQPPAKKYAEASRLNNLRDTFKKLYGIDPAKGLGIDLRAGFQDEDILINNLTEKNIDKALVSEDGLLTRLRKAISKRDSFVSMLSANLSKVEELNEIESFLEDGELESFRTDDINTGDKDFDEGLNKTKKFLESAATNIKNTIDIISGDASQGSVFDHLISDDTRNLLGPGSGKRFIVKDEEIITANFSESPPDFTRVDIEGSAPFVASQLNRGTDSLYFWAGATDFDLWRQYGYRPKKQTVPFISDVENQARPYAILELGLQRMKVNRGSLSIAGNEFYQPGDTVYIPSKGLLYYVSSVRHSLTFGQSFTTTLDLVFGHVPGEYIPGPLDVVGQELVGNMLDDPALITRTTQSDDNYRVLKPDSTLVFPTGGASEVELLAHSDNQVRFTNMMIDAMGTLSGNKYLLIRGFVSSDIDQEEADKVREKISIVKSLFLNPTQISQGHSGAGQLGESIAGPLTAIGSAFGGGSVGTTMSGVPMRLPNNMPVIPIKSSKIVEQITYLERSDDSASSVGEIQCLDKRLASALVASGNIANSDKTVGVFPKGGPRQGGWLDIRDDIVGFNFSGLFGIGKPKINIIEVGVIDIPSNLLNK